tara:strand:- start:302 stop:880 length:579 start_codon:yes stop_codon:yes gene_type:complete
MPGGLQQTTNLTLSGLVSDSFHTTIGKVVSLDGTAALARSIGQAGIIELTSVPADFHEAISVKVRLDDIRFTNPAGSKTNSATVRTTIRDSSSTFYTEDINVLVNRSLNLEGTERTTSDGSALWTSTQLNDLRLGLEVTAAVPNIGSGVSIDFAYIELKYSTAPPLSYDSTIGRIIMDGGNSIIDDGTIIID